ncbi:MAG TPA: hypothetical protein P5531_07890 [Bacteroidales bacterium]|nr:hypothetical protein [Bacteroidales bacterium]HSA43446.1 hypothetical protein [Bacteroidales bacterium]
MSRTLSLIFLITLIISGEKQVSAQADPPLRLEFPVYDDSQPYQVISCGNKGVLLFYPVRKEPENKTTYWTFKLFDQNLREVYTREFPLGEEYEFVFRRSGSDTLLLGFQDSGKKGSQKKITTLLLEINQGVIRSFEAVLAEKGNLVDGCLLPDGILLSYKTKDDISGILINTFGEPSARELIPEPGVKTFIHSIIPSEQRGEFTIVFETFTSKKHSVFKLARYNINGTEIHKTAIDIGNPQYLLNELVPVPLGEKQILLLGAYSNQASRTFTETENKAGESTGFFSSLMEGQQLKEARFYNFLDFKNFFNKMRGNQAIFDSRNIRKDQELSSDYRLLIHDVIRKDQEFILVAEAYYPEYHTVTNWTYDYYGHMVPHYYTVFDGYRYNNVFICAFDTSGRMLWDNSMEISNILTMSLKKRINLIFDEKEIILAYLTDGKIGSKVISRDQTLDGIEYVSIELPDSFDRVVSNKEGNLTRWYDNYLLAYGYQEIKNVRRNDGKREVFYLNKIVFK